MHNMTDIIDTGIINRYSRTSPKGDAMSKEVFYPDSNYFALEAQLDKVVKEKNQLQSQLAAEQEKNRWIPVAERLPEEEGYYLTKYKGDKRQCLDEKTWIRAYPFYGMFKDNWIYKKPTKYSVTHWRPIDLPVEPDGKGVGK